jgi:hypothetical protein
MGYKVTKNGQKGDCGIVNNCQLSSLLLLIAFFMCNFAENNRMR